MCAMIKVYCICITHYTGIINGNGPQGKIKCNGNYVYTFYYNNQDFLHVIITPVAKKSKWLFFQLRQQRANNFIHNLLHTVKEWLFGSALSAWKCDSQHWMKQEMVK